MDDGTRLYQTQLITLQDTKDVEKVAKAKDGFLLKRRILTLKVPQVSTNLIQLVNQWFFFPSYLGWFSFFLIEQCFCFGNSRLKGGQIFT